MLHMICDISYVVYGYSAIISWNGNLDRSWDFPWAVQCITVGH